MRVAIIEDDPSIVRSVSRALREAGHECTCVADGDDAIRSKAILSSDLVVLDLMLPGTPGLEVLARSRAAGVRTPVIVLTARNAVPDRLAGFAAGADDYLVKPFEVRELEARLRTLLRRHRGAVAREVHTVEDLTLDTATLQVTRGGQSLALTPIGLKLLTALMRASPRVVSRQQLEREVWGDLLPDSDTLRSHLYTLRKAIDKPFARPLLHTLPGAGYRLAADDER